MQSQRRTTSNGPSSCTEDALPRAEHVTAQQHADFGVALSVLGRTTDAVQRLQRAIDLGAASAEAHRHLALSALNTDAETGTNAPAEGGRAQCL